MRNPCNAWAAAFALAIAITSASALYLAYIITIVSAEAVLTVLGIIP